MGFFSKLFSSGASNPEKREDVRDTISGTTRTIERDGFRLSLDLTDQKLSFKMPGSWQDESEAHLLPVLQVKDEGFVSAACLVQKAKQIDDGVFAALEVAAEEGTEGKLGKRALLERLAKTLASDPSTPLAEGLAPFFAAAKVAGVSVELPAPMATKVEETLAEFDQDATRSKPLGFYTWTDALSQIYRQDRLLQTELSGRAAIEHLATVLCSDAELRQAYLDRLDSAKRLTNPWPKDIHDLSEWIRAKSESAPLDDLPDQEVCFFPPSQSPETELIKKMFGSSSIPDGFDLANEVVDRVRAGTLSLTPSQNAGYYARQLWSLEPLLLGERMPEGHRYKSDDEYRRYQKELFKAAMALSRETHIKQLEVPAAGAAPFGETRKVIHVSPSVSVEPFASFYQRRADSYAFLRGMIEQSFGTQAARELKRATAEGPTDRSIADELSSLEAVFRAAAARALSELGEGGEAGKSDAFSSFAGSMGSDPDLSRDARMMVPVFFDVERKKTKVWAFLGWRRVSLEIGFDTRPAVRVIDSEGRDATDRVDVELGVTSRSLFVPVARELYVSKLLDRDQMRKLCDREKSEKKIVAALA